VPPPVRARAAPPEEPDDLERLAEHLSSDAGRWPSPPDQVLVQLLAGPDAERETAAAQARDCRGGLRDDRRVVAERGAGDGGDQADALRLCSYRSEDGPRERGMSLARQPGVIVVGDRDEVEAGFLGAARVPDERRRAMLLGHEL